jgi:hypothetical protein
MKYRGFDINYLGTVYLISFCALELLVRSCGFAESLDYSHPRPCWNWSVLGNGLLGALFSPEVFWPLPICGPGFFPTSSPVFRNWIWDSLALWRTNTCRSRRNRTLVLTGNPYVNLFKIQRSFPLEFASADMQNSSLEMPQYPGNSSEQT